MWMNNLGNFECTNFWSVCPKYCICLKKTFGVETFKKNTMTFCALQDDFVQEYLYIIT